ncbi:MAG: pentapeptide repeat-containing protein [Candidatus Bathyarchaeota archaeon]|nr:MAG: pentapeptide repeat-containing protein [Candidatus Bathyarchaeota archaeon]
MANKFHRSMLKKGIAIWNDWKEKNSIIPELRGADLRRLDFSNANLSNANLSRANLDGANLSYANLNDANLSGAHLTKTILSHTKFRHANLHRANLSDAESFRADFRGANLSDVNLSDAILGGATLSEANLDGAKLVRTNLHYACLTGANLSKADLNNSDLRETDLRKANLSNANLSRANLDGADLRYATLYNADLSKARIIETKLNGTVLTGCRVFGISAWELKGLEKAKQSDLIITPKGEPEITVDNLEVAQFIYILLHSEKIRGVIDTITSKVVLILGRFKPERKAILDAIRAELRKRNYLPVIFDFPEPSSRRKAETVSTLAHMARFVIADITDARCVPQELDKIVPHLTSVPVQPILLSSSKEYGLFADFTPYPWVLKIYRYGDVDELLKSLVEKVIDPAEAKAKKLQKGRNKN